MDQFSVAQLTEMIETSKDNIERLGKIRDENRDLLAAQKALEKPNPSVVSQLETNIRNVTRDLEAEEGIRQLHIDRLKEAKEREEKAKKAGAK